jgi:hypothetical protein
MPGRTARVAAVALVVTTAAVGEDRVFSPDLWKVQKVHVGDMGSSDEAARFRLLLEEELTKKAFIVVSDSAAADAVLKGILTVRVYSDESIARATVQLKSADGARLWGGDFEPRSTTFKKVRDTVQFRAENIAGDLRKDWHKAAKAAGQPLKR